MAQTMTNKRDPLAERVGAAVRARRKALGKRQEELAGEMFASLRALVVAFLGVYFSREEELRG